MPAPNVLLVILDSVRAKNCSLYGHDNQTTPFLSELADDAVVFDQARAPSIHSISSHVSIFTGYHVEQHNATEHKSFVKPEATVWHRLAEAGYETGLFTANVIVSETSNLADSFDTYVGPKRANFRLFEEGLAPLDIQGSLTAKEYLREALADDAPVRSVLNGIYKKFESRGGSQDPDSEHGDAYVDDLLSWVDGSDGPWAACLNLMDPHTPFVPDPEHDRWSDESAHEARDRMESADGPDPFTDEFWRDLQALEPLYDGTIRQSDAVVERLVEALATRGVLDDTLLVVTSDHGEGFAERSELDSGVRLRHHSYGIDELLTHVPLLVRTPEADGGNRIRDPVSLTQFPAAVDAALDGADPIAAFSPSGDVVSSTFRIRPPGDELALEESEREKYFGPWRAVYRPAESGDGVRKYARRGDDAITLEIPNAQTTRKLSDTDDQVVESVFGSFSDAAVRLGSADDRDVETEVEERLSDLGYLR
ncbi:sulfatase-like hydrolase/transferase [Halosimplex sp. J119]